MNKFVKWPSIGQFNNVVRHVRTSHDFKGKDEEGKAIYLHDSPYPTLKFTGTVKLHGTNAAVVSHKDGSVTTQSRERIITPESDNAGFAAWLAYMEDEIKDMITPHVPDGFDSVAVFGEWCGGNIQKGVAITQLPKMFVIFGTAFISDKEGEVVKKWFVDDTSLRLYCDGDLEALNENGVYLITQFPTYEIEVDFNTPEIASVKMAEITQAVENECPVGKHFDVSGIGEGVVWKLSSRIEPVDMSYTFKVKGEKHSSSKVKTLAPVDLELVKSVNEFVEKVVTESRLEQGLSYLREMNIPLDMSSTGSYIKWVVDDVRKEETELMEASGLSMKEVGPALQKAIKPFWFKTVNTQF